MGDGDRIGTGWAVVARHRRRKACGRGFRGLAVAAAALLLASAAWLAGIAPGMAQNGTPGAGASTPTPLTQPKDPAPPAADVSACPARPEPGVDRASNVVLTLHPSTLWRPRGGEVRFTVTGKDGATVQVARVQVCLGWSAAPSATADDAATHGLVPSPIVRSIAPAGGGADFGATVPDLPRTPTPWWPPGLSRRSSVGFTAGDTVPVADMVVRVTPSGGAPVTLVVPVGVTSVPYAILVMALCLLGFFVAARLVVRRREPARAGATRTGVWLGLVSTPDGYASLSQFQILLWTLTVGATAVYVMVLSGNLIDLTDGTLVLLGIAGGAALAARIPQATAAPPAPPAARPPAEGDATPAPAAGRAPLWSDLVVVRGSVDLTRVQMLAFTLISAAFVVLKVVATYAIPDIPANFLLLMGISNGVYVTGRRLPGQPAAPVKG